MAHPRTTLFVPTVYMCICVCAEHVTTLHVPVRTPPRKRVGNGVTSRDMHLCALTSTGHVHGHYCTCREAC
jgi:hypothetical protein